MTNSDKKSRFASGIVGGRGCHQNQDHCTSIGGQTDGTQARIRVFWLDLGHWRGFGPLCVELPNWALLLRFGPCCLDFGYLAELGSEKALKETKP